VYVAPRPSTLVSIVNVGGDVTSEMLKYPGVEVGFAYPAVVADGSARGSPPELGQREIVSRTGLTVVAGRLRAKVSASSW
jgi:hypothetical protein